MMRRIVTKNFFRSCLLLLVFGFFVVDMDGNILLAAGDPDDVTINEFPMALQLYPRDPATNVGTVLISGMVATGSGFTDVKVRVERMGAFFDDETQPLDYSNGNAPFSFSIPIAAEMAGYDFELFAVDNSGDTPVTSVVNVVAGDVYLINGQSNANARRRTGSDFVGVNLGPYEYIRSFGRRETCFPGPSCGNSGPTIDPFDTAWHVANADSDTGDGAIGQWGALLARKLIDAHGIPVAFMSNAVSNTDIGKHQKTYSGYSNPYSSQIPFNNIYQRLLWRTQTANVAQHVRAIIWHQGESDSGNSGGHESGFKSLYADWQQDYPNLEQVYIHQIRNIVPSCGAGPDILVREVQRKMGDDPTFFNLQVMSTTAVDAQVENCHYPHASINGLSAQDEIAEHMFNLMARDFYGSADTQNIDAPNIDYAYFTDANKQMVNIVLRDSDDTINFAAGAEQDFLIEGVSAPVTGGSAAGNVLSLALANSAAGATGVSYYGHAGVELSGVPASNWTTAEPRWGEWVTNAKGVGLLAFHNFPIAQDPPAVSITSPAAGTVVDVATPLTISYTASDADGLQATSLYVNSQLITTTTWSAAPLNVTNSVVWTPPASGSYTITVEAVDVMRASASAVPVVVAANAPPTVSIVAPANGSVFAPNSDIIIQANPQDADGSIALTNFYADGVLLGTPVTSSPWQYTWSGVPFGTYDLTALTQDNVGSSATSPAVTIRVNEPPTVSLLSPITGTVFVSGTSNPLLGAAPADNDGAISSVEFYNGAFLITSLVSAPWTYDWVTAPVGIHTLSARVYDNDGALATSAPVQVEVQMPTPTPTSTPTPVDTPTPTSTPTPVPTDTPTPTPTSTPTLVPTDTPTPLPTDTPTLVPTDTPTPLVTDTPTPTPTPAPQLSLMNSSNAAAPGSNFIVTASGFPPTTTVSFKINGAILGAYTTDSSGELTLLIKTLPEIVAGAYTIVAEQYSGVSTAFVVDPAANVVTPIAAGTVVTLPQTTTQPTTQATTQPTSQATTPPTSQSTPQPTQAANSVYLPAVVR